ncbi:FHA domain-containing protein [Chloroflexota bacterium]
MDLINNAQFRISGLDDYLDEIIVGTQGLTVGRSGENDYTLRHRELSRQHLRITWREDGRYLVEDLDSSNGSWINDKRLVPEVPVELNEGDIIRVGPYLFRLERLFGAMPTERTPDVLHPRLESERTLARRVQMPIHVPGVDSDRSNWLRYLPAIYSENDLHGFLGRFLLIFESIWSPIIWQIDNFEMYLSPDTAPGEWLRWMASWFDLLLVPELSLERQRTIVHQIGWLFLRRGTPAGLHRLLELYFGVGPEIIEDEPCHFVVRLPLSQMAATEETLEIELAEQVASQLIEAQKPAFASYHLEII